MAEYIKRETAIEIVKSGGYWEKEDMEVAVACIEQTPSADAVEVKQIEIIRDDLKWWLETNTEKGVVYIPKYVVENMIAKMDGK